MYCYPKNKNLLQKAVCKNRGLPYFFMSPKHSYLIFVLKNNKPNLEFFLEEKC